LRLLALVLALFSALLTSCTSVEVNRKPTQVEHVYIEPVTNRRTEEALDVIFTRVANDVFYSDPRFRVDLTPIPDGTLMIKPAVTRLSTFAVGFDERDRVTEYRMTATVKFKVFKYGFKTPLATFTITRRDFYDTTGTASEIEEKRRACIERIAEQIFREVGERLLQIERGKGVGSKESKER